MLDSQRGSRLRELTMSRITDALYVPYASDTAWIVRRARTVVASHASQREAIEAARRLAARMSRGPNAPSVSVAIQAEDGSWTMLPIDPDTPARTD